MGKPKEHQKIRFGGDDLEDDFMEESILVGKKDGISNTNSASGVGVGTGKTLKDTHAKPKKQGPKIVNFLG